LFDCAAKRWQIRAVAKLLLISRMKQITLIALLMAAAASSAVPAAAANRFAGVWVAMFKGTVVCTLEIEEKDGQISGASKACKISVDQNGDLIDGEKPDGSETPEPFIGPKADGAILRYEQDDDGKPIKFELRLTGDDKAELRIVNAPITVKPIKFEHKP
jgi:hypothetical protein